MFIKFNNYFHPIISVDLNSSEDILLLKTDLYTYRFEAIGDCCSTSMFKKFKNVSFSSIVGKIIKGIKEINEEEEYETEEEYESVSPHLYEMSFKNSDETFKFYLINYSNGYYDGWINSSVVLL